MGLWQGLGMADVNLWAAWIGFLLGAVAGAAQGLFIHDEAWLGGYDSWRRRMMRLGHVSFFGIGLLNLAHALTVRALALTDLNPWSGRLLIVGAIAMPLVCYLAAWRKECRQLFPIPVLSVAAGIAIFLVTGLAT